MARYGFAYFDSGVRFDSEDAPSGSSMRDLASFLRNPFDDPKISAIRLIAFTTDHLQRMSANNETCMAGRNEPANAPVERMQAARWASVLTSTFPLTPLTPHDPDSRAGGSHPRRAGEIGLASARHASSPWPPLPICMGGHENACSLNDA